MGNDPKKRLPPLNTKRTTMLLFSIRFSPTFLLPFDLKPNPIGDKI
jgi:hypothetical protein